VLLVPGRSAGTGWRTAAAVAAGVPVNGGRCRWGGRRLGVIGGVSAGNRCNSNGGYLRTLAREGWGVCQ
jgi:hypothetical protein